MLWSWATFCERPVTTTPRRRNDRATSPNGHVLTGDLRDGLLGAVAACELDGLHMYSSWPRSWACSPSSRGVRLDLRALPRRLGGPRDGRDVDRRGENEAEERLVTRASYVSFPRERWGERVRQEPACYGLLAKKLSPSTNHKAREAGVSFGKRIDSRWLPSRKRRANPGCTASRWGGPFGLSIRCGREDSNLQGPKPSGT